MSERPIRIIALFGSRVIYGQERANIETLAALAASGCKVLCLVRDESWPELLLLCKMLGERGIKYLRVPYIDYPIKGWILHAILRNPWAFVRCNVALMRVHKRFRATHIHAFNPLYVASFLVALNKLNIPMIYRAGDRPILHNAVYRKLWSYIKRRSAHFVADSKFIRRSLEESGVPGRQISVVYLPAPWRPAAPSAAIPAAASASDAFRFVFVGQITAAKGVDVLIDAFRLIAARHPSVHLIVAGRLTQWRGDAWGNAVRAAAAADEKLAQQVHFVGYVENSIQLICACDVHVAPSMAEEPYGLVAVEAKEAGRPSVIFESGGMTELVEDGVDGAVVNPRNAMALANALEKYLEQDGLAEKQGEAARRSIDRLGLRDYASRWHEVYVRNQRVAASSA